jgi:hypothetical protein
VRVGRGWGEGRVEASRVWSIVMEGLGQEKRLGHFKKRAGSEGMHGRRMRGVEGRE